MGLAETYNYYIYELADVRTLNWLFNGSPVPLFLLTLAYLVVTLKIAPAYMKNRPAYSLRTYTRCYDLAQVAANAMIIYAVYASGWFSQSWLICVPQHYATYPLDNAVTNIGWWVFIIKIIDYSETVVFVLRKKYKQVSFLHLYHHVSTVWLAWFVLRYFCLRMTIFFMIVNCFVHIIMYSYYFLATCGPTVQAYLRMVKRLITIMQMVQFCILLLYSANVFLPDCRNMRVLAAVMSLNLVINFCLFYNFYKQSYNKSKVK